MRRRGIVLAGLLAGLALHRARASEPDCTRAASAGRAGLHLVYLKREHMLCLQADEKTLWSARASHGRNPGKKQLEGDGRTPEGAYTLAPARKSRSFGTFLAISYPNRDDISYAHSLGKQPGSAVGIHGPQSWYAFLGSWQAAVDHSEGCIV